MEKPWHISQIAERFISVLFSSSVIGLRTRDVKQLSTLVISFVILYEVKSFQKIECIRLKLSINSLRTDSQSISNTFRSYGPRLSIPISHTSFTTSYITHASFQPKCFPYSFGYIRSLTAHPEVMNLLRTAAQSCRQAML